MASEGNYDCTRWNPVLTDVYKCEPIHGNLFTNASGEAQDCVLKPEGGGGEHVTMLAWPADTPCGSPPRGSKPSMQTEECTRLPIPEGVLISENANGQSGDQQPQPPMAED